MCAGWGGSGGLSMCECVCGGGCCPGIKKVQAEVRAALVNLVNVKRKHSRGGAVLLETQHTSEGGEGGGLIRGQWHLEELSTRSSSGFQKKGGSCAGC